MIEAVGCSLATLAKPALPPRVDLIAAARELKPLWKALAAGFTELQRLCLSNDDVRRHTTAFDGPGSKLGE